MSPATKAFALFSVSPRILAVQYNTMIMNTTTQQHYDPGRLDADLVVLPDVYRIGMSGVFPILGPDMTVLTSCLGVCREFHDRGEVICTRQFPQPLDIVALIDTDIRKSDLQSSAASHLQEFFDSLTKNDKNRFVKNKSQYISFAKASAGLMITSLLIAPLGLGFVLFMYKFEKPGYTTVATCVALFDAALVLTASTLWITGSLKYSFDIMETIGSGSMQTTSFWGATDVIPSSIGLFIFACAALLKLIVLPIMALICLIGFCFLIVLAAIMAWLMFMMVMCMLAMFASADNGTTTETVYYTTYTPDWADS